MAKKLNKFHLIVFVCNKLKIYFFKYCSIMQSILNDLEDISGARPLLKGKQKYCVLSAMSRRAIISSVKDKKLASDNRFSALINFNTLFYTLFIYFLTCRRIYERRDLEKQNC